MQSCPTFLDGLFEELKTWLAVGRLLRCRLFDLDHYCGQAPTAPRNRLLALRHYLRHGATAAACPHPDFDAGFYLAANPDVAAAGVNPLLHYVLHGAAEGRLPVAPRDVPESAPDVACDFPAALAPTRVEPPAPRPSRPPRPQAVFVSPLLNAPSGLYRVDHAGLALDELGYDVHIVPVADVFSRQALLAGAEVVVLHRVGWTEATGAVFEAARQAGARLVYDADDDVFSPGLSDNAALVDGLRFLTPEQSAVLAEGTLACRRALLACDVALAATGHLADRMTAAGRPATVTRNTFGPAFAARCREALAARAARTAGGDPSLVRLGYASGTSTHQRDFAVITPTLARLLGRHPGLTLTVAGCLDLAEYPELAPYAGRIEVRPLVPHAALPAELARFDVNLAPLEADNLFCRSKSEVKYLEAALVEVPTVASAIPAFAAAVASGRTGLVAADEAAWEAGLEGLIRDAGLRRRLGRAAREHVERDYGPRTRRREWRAFLVGLGGCPGETAR